MDQKDSKFQHHGDVYSHQDNFIAHIFLLHQVLLERYKAI